MADDLARWKDKYFKKIEEFERSEKALAEHRHVLERLVVRVSLAAEGADRELDRELGSLRGLLRQDDHSLNALSGQLERIETIVLAMDEQRAGVSEALLRAFDGLLELSADNAVSREQRKAVKRLKTEIGRRGDDPKELPALLDAIRQVLAMLLAQNKPSGPAGPEDPPGGFFSRLFGGKESDNATDDSMGEGATQVAPLREENAEDSYEIQSSEAGGETMEAEGFARVEGRIRTILSNLLEQLTIPSSIGEALETIHQRLGSSMSWYELVPTLEEVTALIMAAVGSGQAEFEHFLQDMDERLATLQAFLVKTEANQVTARSHNAALEGQVRNQVSHMQAEVKSAQDLDGLKSSVATSLDTIMSSLDEFMQKEQVREQGSSDEIEALKARLAEMEQETQAMKVHLQEERQRAMTDVLTQLPNRLAIEARSNEEFDRWKRYDRPLSLAVCDIDFFKRINDNYGHLAGDRVLQLIAKEVSRRVRATDFLARYGGEEFVVLLPETALEQAAAVMEKTREMVSRLPFHFRNEKVQITMSFGVTQFQEQDSLESVFERADRALYRAKESGRNQVQLAP